MKRIGTSVLLALPTFVMADAALAVSFGLLRPFQHGAIGDSPQFATFGHYEAEGAVLARRAWGHYKVNEALESKTSSADFQTRIQAGGGFSPNKQFALSGYVDVTLGRDFDLERQRTDPQVTYDAGLYRHEVAGFAIFRASPIILGGGLGVVIYGSETKEFSFKENEEDETPDFKSEITSAAMPVVRLFGGIDTKEVTATAGVRLFSQGEAVVEAETPDGKKYEYDIARRNPAELHVDGRLKLGKVVTLGASVAYVLTGQASESLDEFSMRFGSGELKERKTGGDTRNGDHFRIGIGGRFDPVDMVGVMAGLQYVGASYKNEEYASLEHENLGGIRLDVGTEVKVQKRFRGFLHMGYGLDSTVEFKVSDGSRTEANVDRTLAPPLNEGDKVEMTQGYWEIVAGGGIVL